MGFHVFGPLACNKNDLSSLQRSNFLDLFYNFQVNQQIKFTVFGDSAYEDYDDLITSGGGRGMASVRETIEWTYKNLKHRDVSLQLQFHQIRNISHRR